MMAAADAADASPQGAVLPGESARRLPDDLANLDERRRKLRELQQTLQAQDEARRKEGKDPQKNPAQSPKADADAKMMPNKEGGYAANYAPLESSQPQPGNPACREDFRRPVAEEDWPKLPRNPQKQ